LSPFGVQIFAADGQGGSAAAGGFPVQADQEAVQDGVVTAGRDLLVDRGQLVGGQGAAGGGRAVWLGDAGGRVADVGDGSAVDGADRHQHVLGGAGAAAGVAVANS